ncbi:ArsR/SmtB family transcription factor [Pseudaminobacter manganicus]|uniref:Transcriptional regulator n=1 Tax=Manganibacter manganicus TaxID=1873176 RepID=A0A1V8RJY4_9HYPH|nr:transcriptional regulator [Pseudaminobacter manganicus]
MNPVFKNPLCCTLDARQMAIGFAALSHPARIEILRHLSTSSSCCCSDVVGRLDLAQSTVSQHLKILVEAGLVRYAADGKRSRYAVNGEALTVLAGAVSELVETCCPAGDH